MSKISEYLSNILSSIYGKDVRQSIHDAIEQCYEDVTNGVTKSETAAANAQSVVETVNKAAQNADAKANIAVESSQSALRAAEEARTSASNADAKAALAQKAASDVTSSVNKADAWGNATVTVEAIPPDGAADVEVTRVSDQPNNIHFFLPRGSSGVVTSDTEPEDPDVTVWIKPGEDPEPDIVQQVSQLKDTTTTLVPIDMIPWHFVRAINSGETPGTFAKSTSGYACALLPCKSGDEFIVSGTGGSSSARLYAFISADNRVLKNAGQSLTLENETLVAPEGAALFAINDMSGGTSYRKVPVNAMLEEDKERIEKLTGIDDVKKLVFVPGYYASGVNASFSAESIKVSTAGYGYAGVDCVAGDQFVLNCTVAEGIRSYIFVDKDSVIIAKSREGENLKNAIITAPENAARLYVNDKGGGVSYKGVPLPFKTSECDFENSDAENSDLITAYGRYNACMRGKQISHLEYVTKAEMPYQINGYVGYQNIGLNPEGTALEGVPYSSAQHNGGQIGTDVSLYTFLSAIQNPKSKVYTFRDGIMYNGFLWYGTVCTGLVCYALNIGENYPTSYFNAYLHEDFEEIHPYNVQFGDVMAKDGHVRLVTFVERDKYDRIKNVEITESVHSYAKTTTKTFEQYMRDIDSDGYHIVRYKKVADVKYTPDGCVNLEDETTAAPTFPDIIPDRGDKCVVHVGDEIACNVINAAGYTSIQVYLNDTLIDTRNVEDFTITAQAGKYEIHLVGASKTSKCYFIAIDCEASYADNAVTYSAEYGKLQSVTRHKVSNINANGVYGTQTAAYAAMVLDDPQSAGVVDVTAVLTTGLKQTIDAGDYLCLHFKCEYGRVEFKVMLA